MCIRYRISHATLSEWTIKSQFRFNFDADSLNSEHFPGSDGVIGISDLSGNSIFEPAQWGLIPSWSKDKNFGKKYAYNARSETLLDKPTFKEPFKSRRCLIPFSDFYERSGGRWFQFSLEDDAVYGFAGLYEPPNKHCEQKTYTIITSEPNQLVADYHDRMPVILGVDKFADWLGEQTTVEDLQSLLVPAGESLLSVADAGAIKRS